MKLSLDVAAVAFALGLTGCAGEDARRKGQAEEVAFAADAPPAPERGAAVYLRRSSDTSAEKSRVRLDVVARGAAELHGAALRVTFDPDALAFAAAEPSPAWSRKSMGVTKEGTPGQLAVAWFEKGERVIDASEETVLGALTFDVRGAKGSAVQFRDARSALVGREGRHLATSFRGGRVLDAARR